MNVKVALPLQNYQTHIFVLTVDLNGPTAFGNILFDGIQKSVPNMTSSV
jgi:hypothetical protein